MENDDITEPDAITNPEIDKLTLELFMNKKKYKKYVEQTDPKKHSELQSHYADIRKYRGSILNMTDDLLETPDMQITTEINELFDIYSRTIIRYLKNKELEKSATNYHENENNDEDIMFGIIDEPATPTMNSFWSGEKVTRKNYNQKDIFEFLPRR